MSDVISPARDRGRAAPCRRRTATAPAALDRATAAPVSETRWTRARRGGRGWL